MTVPDDFPETLPEFESRFRSERQCRDYLARIRWPDGFVCPKCGGREAFPLNARPLIECECGHQTSVTAGTIFHGTRKPLRLWFKAMFLLFASKSGLSATTLMCLMGFRYQTAWTWLHKLRKAMVRPDRSKLEGKVELDESYFGGVREGTRGRGTTNPIVLCAVERLDSPTEEGPAPARAPPTVLGRVRLEVVEDATQVSTTTFAAENIAPGTKVLTDGLTSYRELTEVGFVHKPRAVGRPKNAAKVLPGVHRVISLVKRWLLGTHQGAVSQKHLPSYLHEYEFRFNRRRSSSRAKLFHRLLELAVVFKPITYREIVNTNALAPAPP